MEQIEIIAHLVDVMRAAIKSKDWIVDGACDPDFALSIAEAKLEQEGWHQNSVSDEWQID